MPLTVTVDAETHAALTDIGKGNRSAAIELLVRHFLATRDISTSSNPLFAP